MTDTDSFVPAKRRGYLYAVEIDGRIFADVNDFIWLLKAAGHEDLADNLTAWRTKVEAGFADDEIKTKKFWRFGC